MFFGMLLRVNLLKHYASYHLLLTVNAYYISKLLVNNQELTFDEPNHFLS